MHQIIFAKKAEKQLKKLPRIIQTRILSALKRARIRPESFFERLVGEKSYKLRVGNYRIIADIDGGRLIILVLQVGHQKNIYKL